MGTPLWRTDGSRYGDPLGQMMDGQNVKDVGELYAGDAFFRDDTYVPPGFFDHFLSDTGLFGIASGNPAIASDFMTVTPTTSYLRRRTIPYWNLTAQSFEFPVTNMFNATNTGAVMWVQLRNNVLTDAERLEWNWSITGGAVHMYASTFNAANTGTDLVNLTYNASTHKYLRIREDLGTLYWDYSADAITWTNAASTTLASWGYAINKTYIDVGSGLGSGTTNTNPTLDYVRLGIRGEYFRENPTPGHWGSLI